MELIKELASKAQWVADLMSADGVVAAQVTPELVLAYMDEVGRKITEIQSAYLSRVGAKQAMQSTVMALL